MDPAQETKQAPLCERVLVIGLDGATRDVLLPLAAEGVMPHLAELLQRSVCGAAQSTLPFITPVAWTTFQTGCDPQAHGIWDFRHLDHQQRELRLNHAGRIAMPTIFDAVTESGGGVVSINLPMTYPAKPSEHAIIAGGFDSPSAQAVLAPYEVFAAQLQAKSIPYPLKTVWKEAPETAEELHSGVAQTIRAYQSRTDAALVADGLIDWRLMVVQMQTLDSLQHRCWHLLDLESECTSQLPAPADWVREIRKTFTALDAEVGRLLELASARGAAVVLVSDHGFGDFQQKINVPQLLMNGGLMKLGSNRGLGFRIDRSLWKMRRWVWKRRRRGSSSASIRRPLTAMLPIDWRQSRAVSLHGDLAAMIYLNTAERMGSTALSAVLTTSTARDQALADSIACLRDARHPEHRTPLFVEVFSTAERFGQDPIEQGWPDVIGIPAPGLHTRSRLGQDNSLMIDDARLTGTHRRDGLLLMADLPGTCQSSLETADAHLRDVAPTICHLLGLQPTSPMQGVSLLSEQPALACTTTVPSSHASWKPQAAPTQLSQEQQQVVESRLRDLGYLD